MLLLIFLAATLLSLGAFLRLFVRLGPRKFAITIVSFAAVIGGFVGLVKITGCADDDRPALVDETIDGRHRLRHPTFDFAFAHPGAGYVANGELADSLERVAGASCDAFTATRGDATFAVCAVDANISSRDAFDEELLAVRRGIARATTPRGGFAGASLGSFAASLNAPPNVRGTLALEALAANQPTTIADDEGWANGEGSAYLHLVSRGIHLRIKLFTVDRGVALMIVTSANGDILGDVVTSFSRVR